MATCAATRTHKRQRAGLGLLEKGKDWKLRRDDFHSKERRLRALTARARGRNEDEFYFAMKKQKTVGGVHQAARLDSRQYTADEIKLMNTQDVAYLTMRRTQERHKIERLRGQLHGLDALGMEAGDEDDGADEAGPVALAANPARGQHIVFVDTKDDCAGGPVLVSAV